MVINVVNLIQLKDKQNFKPSLKKLNAPENVEIFPPSHLLGLLLAQLVGNVLQPLHLGTES